MGIGEQCDLVLPKSEEFTIPPIIPESKNILSKKIQALLLAILLTIFPS